MESGINVAPLLTHEDIEYLLRLTRVLGESPEPAREPVQADVDASGDVIMTDVGDPPDTSHYVVMVMGGGSMLNINTSQPQPWVADPQQPGLMYALMPGKLRTITLEAGRIHFSFE